MADKPIKAERLANYQQSRGVATSLGELLLETPSGDIVRSIDAPGYSTLLVHGADADGARIAVLLWDVAPAGADAGPGMVCQMTADEARTIAGSLLRLAAQIDPSKPH